SSKKSILNTHRALDAANEAAKGAAKIGTTGKGIGPTYTDKISRNGVRVGDIFLNFSDIYAKAKARHEQILTSLNYDYNVDELEKAWFEAIEYLKGFTIIDSEHVVNKFLANGDTILAEGAQGTLLDVDFGSYPFVTSSNTVCAGACTGLGVAPNKIGEVFGIFKAYCTRVGSGPFPTELFDETGKQLRDIGHEYGAVTGRERRCGWLDMVALKYAIMVDGATQLIMMKSDVMNDFETIKVAVAYEIDGERTEDFPYTVECEIKPIYREFKGWKCDICGIRKYEEFPVEFKEYVEFIEEQTGVPIKVISVGPDREETIIRA
ncbi:MAG: adenylosuccinate synthetase, partial [Rikenellaceae bacterium]